MGFLDFIKKTFAGEDVQLEQSQEQAVQEEKEQSAEEAEDQSGQNTVAETSESVEQIAETVPEETESEDKPEESNSVQLEIEPIEAESSVDEIVEEASAQSAETAVESPEKSLDAEIKEEATEITGEVEEASDTSGETEEVLEIAEEAEKFSEATEAEEVVQESQADETQIEETEKPLGFFAKLKAGLNKTRESIFGSIDSVLGGFTKIDEDLFEELEEALILADLGVKTSMDIVECLRDRVKKERVTDPSAIKGMLAEEIAEILKKDAAAEMLSSPTVILVIGVNGVGKTTTIGKLAHVYRNQGKKVMLAAADTFRAAAIDQLEVWGERNGVPVIKKEEKTDPAAVVFEAAHAAKSAGVDILLCDTAGRLHNKKNLMEELKKIARVIEREWPEAHREVYLVLDATTGQNALQQAKLFNEVAEITGIVLTKLDGTAKGGIVVAIKSEMEIPVRFIGVGEKAEDLQPFDAESFAKALFEL